MASNTNGSTAVTATKGQESAEIPQSNMKIDQEDTDEGDYIVVTDREDELGNKLELPAESDGTLTISTLAHSFPDAIGLKFKNPNTGIYRALAVDSAGTRILAPKGGWGGKTYVVILRPKEPAVISHPVVPSPAFGTESARAALAVKRHLEEAEQLMRQDPQFMSKSQRLTTNLTGIKNESMGAKSNALALDDHECGESSSGGSLLPSRKTCDLVVLNLPFKTTSEGLKTYFEQFGEVTVAEIKTDFRTGQPKGFGFVQMHDYDAQCKVLEQYEHFIDGRMTQVKIPNSRNRPKDMEPQQSLVTHLQPQRPPISYAPQMENVKQEPICTKMYVGRVPASFTQDEIRTFFDKEAKKLGHHAQVEHVLIPKPHRGFAFVTFNDAEITKKIIKTSDFVINGVSVCVSAASPKDQQQNMNQPPPPLQSGTPNAPNQTLGGPANYGAYPYGFTPRGPPPPRESTSFPPREDSTWSGSGGGGQTGVNWNGSGAHGAEVGAYSGYGVNYSPYAQNRTAPIAPSQQNPLNDTNLQAAWTAFWSTLQGQGTGSGAAPPMGQQQQQSQQVQSQNPGASSGLQPWQWTSAMGQNATSGLSQPSKPESAAPPPANNPPTWPGKS